MSDGNVSIVIPAFQDIILLKCAKSLERSFNTKLMMTSAPQYSLY